MPDYATGAREPFGVDGRRELSDLGAGAASGEPALEGDAPLVLVSMSTTFQNQRPSLQRVVDALARLPVRALVTT